jgi:hypothetical protein
MIHFCKSGAIKRWDELKKSGAEVTEIEEDWLEKKLFDYTADFKKNIFDARQEENPRLVKNKVSLYVILYRNIFCYGVCFTIQDTNKVLGRCRDMESSGNTLISLIETDLHSLVKDMQNKETKTSFTGYPFWPFIAPFYQLKRR